MTTTVTTSLQAKPTPAAGLSTNPQTAKQNKLWAVSKQSHQRFKPGSPLGGNGASCSCDGSEIGK